MRRFWESIRKQLSKVSLVSWLGIAALILGYAGLVDGSLPSIRGLQEFYHEVAAELFGIGIGVLLIDLANERRATRERKEELILQMGIPSSFVSSTAVEILRGKGWLFDGTLRGSNLQAADLSNLDLEHSNLRYVNLEASNLSKTRLKNADLSQSNLRRAKLREAYLPFVNLQAADMAYCDLQSAYFEEVNLRGAGLIGAKLRNAIFIREECDFSTQLPDGTKWARRGDLERFTNPNHPKFWEG